MGSSATQPDLAELHGDEFAVSALPDLMAELDAVRRSVEVAEAKLLARLHSSGHTTRDVGHVTAAAFNLAAISTFGRPGPALYRQIPAR